MGFDVFLFDRATGTRRLLSARPDGVPANGSSQWPAIERGAVRAGETERRWIAFASRATDLVGDDPDATSDVFLFHMASPPDLQRISRGLGSFGCDAPSLGDFTTDDNNIDGGKQRVLFACTDAAAGFARSLWLHESGQTDPRLLWQGPPGAALGRHELSANGRFVAFSSDASVDTSDTNGLVDVYVLDVESGQFERISRSVDGGDGNGYADAASISMDGCVVAFHSVATNLASETVPATQHVFVRDRCANRIEIASADLAGEHGQPSLSGNGHFVAFETTDPQIRHFAGLDPGSGSDRAVAIRRLGANGVTLAMFTGIVDGSIYTRSARYPAMSLSNFQSGRQPTLVSDDHEEGHEVAVLVTGTDGVPQVALVESPFPLRHVPVFSSSFEP